MGWATKANLTVIGLSFVPLLLVISLPSLLGWGNVVELPAPVFEETSVAPELLDNLASDLIGMAIAILAGCIFLIRDWRDERIPADLVVIASLAMICAVASVYSGYRFRFALAEQIVISPLNLDLIGDRLAAQGLFLILAVCGLLYLTLSSLVRAGDMMGPKKKEDGDGK